MRAPLPAFAVFTLCAAAHAQTAPAEAEMIAEQLRSSVQLHVSAPDGRAVTMSVGVTGAHPGKVSDTDLVRSADAAVYRAKSLGRNRVVATAAASTAG